MRREALDNLRQLYRGKNETTKLYEVLQRLHESSPNEAAITADLARLGLDVDENTEHSHQLAKEAYDRAPNDVNCAVTYALSLHRLGRNPEALAIVQSLPPEALHDPHAAVYVALVLVEANFIRKRARCSKKQRQSSLRRLQARRRQSRRRPTQHPRCSVRC